MTPEKPWVSFCMSTYKRPGLLQQQLSSLSRQLFTNFEVVISDNDPEASARQVVNSFKDVRFIYYHNAANLGMIKSFNRSIDRATSPYIVMITDDDPVQENFLADIFEIYQKNTGFGLYAGFLRQGKKAGEAEVLTKESFATEILDPKKTSNILWSSCLIKKNIALQMGKIPDFGSPHLADNAFIAMAGSLGGGIIVNRMYSTFTSHPTNFSKSHLDSYLAGCRGFYETLINYFATNPYLPAIKRALNAHLQHWFISNIFNLKKYYTVENENKKMLLEIQGYARSILLLPFMKQHRGRYYRKNFIFNIKKNLKLL